MGSGSACGCIPTILSGSSPALAHSRRSAHSAHSITSGWMDRATIARCLRHYYRHWREFSAPQIATHAMTEPRPHRAALPLEAAADALRQEVRQGRLDGEAVQAVLAVAGHRVSPTRRAWVAGLSDREVEVL